ncbi:hypothetical protein FOMPIDRAFT_61202 [Fomitopsis schrenkii]|uniref:Uncharacterized protein n=1 Tax=Fomitopsis schrenkii TaxID=2126942 RepID=S8DWH9_FOMSC|nr:hypothetical protein FOMPIDRAFT_61202 [Fomitopsis schrenkii]
MSSFPINLAQLVAFFMESVTWGIQIVTFTQCVWALFEAGKNEGGRRRVNMTLLTWAVALFVWGTLDISFAAYRNITAFVYYTGPGGSIEIFSQISDYVTVLRVRITSRSSRAALNKIHRCYVLYNQSLLVIAFPSLIWTAALASAAAEIYFNSTFNALTNLAGAAKLENFLDAFIALAVSFNIITTAMILYRVGQTQNASAKMLTEKHDDVPSSGHMRWSRLSQILVESAMVYTLAGIVLLVVNFVGSNAVYPMSDLTLQIAGIQYDVIIIRVCRGISAEQRHSASQYPSLDTEYDAHTGNVVSETRTTSLRDSKVGGTQDSNADEYVATQV